MDCDSIVLKTMEINNCQSSFSLIKTTDNNVKSKHFFIHSFTTTRVVDLDQLFQFLQHESQAIPQMIPRTLVQCRRQRCLPSFRWTHTILTFCICDTTFLNYENMGYVSSILDVKMLWFNEIDCFIECIKKCFDNTAGLLLF